MGVTAVPAELPVEVTTAARVTAAPAAAGLGVAVRVVVVARTPAGGEMKELEDPLQPERRERQARTASVNPVRMKESF